MKKSFRYMLVAALMAVSSVVSFSHLQSQTGNLINNPSVENTTAGMPDQWQTNTWGTNTSNFTYENIGRTGSRSLKVTLASRTDGVR